MVFFLCNHYHQLQLIKKCSYIFLQLSFISRKVHREAANGTMGIYTYLLNSFQCFPVIFFRPDVLQNICKRFISWFISLKANFQIWNNFWQLKDLLKLMKNAFYITLKALLVIKKFVYLSWIFGHVRKRLD